MSRSDDDSAWRRPAGLPADAPAPGSPAPGPARPPRRPVSAIEAAIWGRPAGLPADAPADSSTDPAAQPAAGPAGGSPDFLAYAGPPPSNPPPSRWRPSVVNQPHPPRELPTQDHDRLEIEEQAARTLTQGIGMVVGAILIVLLLVLCARGFF